MNREMMLHYFEKEYEDPIGEIMGDNPEFKRINDLFSRNPKSCASLWGVSILLRGIYLKKLWTNIIKLS